MEPNPNGVGACTKTITVRKEMNVTIYMDEENGVQVEYWFLC